MGGLLQASPAVQPPTCLQPSVTAEDPTRLHFDGKLPYFEPFLEELTGCLNATAPGNDTDLATDNSTESFNDYGTDDYCEELRGLVATLGRLLSNR